MDDLFEWGIIVRPQGIRGGMKAETDLDSREFTEKIRSVFIEENGQMKEYAVRALSGGRHAVIIELDTINDRNAAERMRGRRIFITRKDHPLPENTNLISDLIGCRILGINSQINIGTVKDVTRFPAQDVYTYTDGQNEWMVPALAMVFPKVDIETHTIYADETLLSQMSVKQEH